MPKKPKKMPPRKTVSADGHELEYLEDTEIDKAELAADMEKVAEIEDEISDCRINFRWDSEHLRVVKLAAIAHKMPYQRYIKEVVYAHAQQVLQQQSLPGTVPYDQCASEQILVQIMELLRRHLQLGLTQPLADAKRHYLSGLYVDLLNIAGTLPAGMAEPSVHEPHPGSVPRQPD